MFKNVISNFDNKIKNSTKKSKWICYIKKGNFNMKKLELDLENCYGIKKLKDNIINIKEIISKIKPKSKAL